MTVGRGDRRNLKQFQVLHDKWDLPFSDVAAHHLYCIDQTRLYGGSTETAGMGPDHNRILFRCQNGEFSEGYTLIEGTFMSHPDNKEMPFFKAGFETSVDGKSFRSGAKLGDFTIRPLPVVFGNDDTVQAPMARQSKQSMAVTGIGA